MCLIFVLLRLHPACVNIMCPPSSLFTHNFLKVSPNPIIEDNVSGYANSSICHVALTKSYVSTVSYIKNDKELLLLTTYIRGSCYSWPICFSFSRDGYSLQLFSTYVLRCREKTGSSIASMAYQIRTSNFIINLKGS